MPEPARAPITVESLTKERNTAREEARELRSGVGQLTEIVQEQSQEISRLYGHLRELWALGEPPYYYATFKGFSDIEDPRKKFSKEMKVENSYMRCVLMLADGNEVIGTVSLYLSGVDKLEVGQFVCHTKDYVVTSLVPDDEVKSLRALYEFAVHEVVGNIVLLTNAQGASHHASNFSEKVALEIAEKPLVPGDRVLCFGNCMTAIIERQKPPSASRENIKHITLDQVGGMEIVLKEVLETLGAVERDGKYVVDQEVLSAMGQDTARGIVLHGPPGNGKGTFVALLAHLTGWTLHLVNGPEIMSKWVGITEELIREKFRVAQQAYTSTGTPALLVFDEAETLFPLRGMHTNMGYKGDYVGQFNVLMDGIVDTPGVFVIIITNRLDMLDPAVIRPGRNDKKIFIPRPTRAQAKKIIEVYFRKRPIAEEGDPEAVKDKWIEAILDDLYKKSKDSRLFTATFQTEAKDFYFKHIVSGALLRNIVQKVGSRAATRLAVAGIRPNEKGFGILQEDLKGIVKEVAGSAVPKNQSAVIQWLMVNGYSEATSVYGGLFDDAAKGEDSEDGPSQHKWKRDEE